VPDRPHTAHSARSITVISMGSVLLPADRSSKAALECRLRWTWTVRCVEQGESHWAAGCLLLLLLRACLVFTKGSSSGWAFYVRMRAES
jgi:hypothetical protein